MSLNTATRRVSEVAASVKRQFGDESGVQITDQDIIRWVDDAQRELASQLKIIKGRATDVTVAGQSAYVLPLASAEQIETIHIDGVRVPGTTLAQAEEVIHNHTAAVQAVTRPTLWYAWNTTITFWPTPVGGLPLTIYYSGIPAQITSVGDLIGIPDKYYDSIHAYVMAKVFQLDEEFTASNDQMQTFLNKVNEQSENDSQGATLMYPMITIIEE